MTTVLLLTLALSMPADTASWKKATLLVAPVAVTASVLAATGNWDVVDDTFDDIENVVMGKGWVEHTMVSMAGSSMAAAIAGRKGYALASFAFAGGYTIREIVELDYTDHDWTDFIGDLIGPWANAYLGARLLGWKF